MAETQLSRSTQSPIIATGPNRSRRVRQLAARPRRTSKASAATTARRNWFRFQSRPWHGAYYADGSTAGLSDSSNVYTNSTGGCVNYTYTALAQVATIEQGGGDQTSKEAVFDYLGNGQVSTLTTYSGFIGSGGSQVAGGGYGYDDDGRLISLAYTQGGLAVKTSAEQPISYGVEYDKASNITQVTSVDGTDNLGLDNSDQLQSASLTSENHSYDQNGNPIGTGYVIGAGNELLSDGTFNYAYDKNGNCISRTRIASATASDYKVLYTWDYDNRLTQVTNLNNSGTVTQVVTYTYDYQGDMIRRGVGTSLSSLTFTYTVYAGANPYLQVTDTVALGASGSSPAVSERYLYGPAVDQILATDSLTGTANVRYGLADYQGTICDVVNYAGVEASGGHVEFSSFGAPVGGISAVAADFLFGLAGMRMDPVTGAYEALARWYSPTATRFLSPDPAGMAGSGTNLYAYCGNSPVEEEDPSGLCASGYSAGSAFGSISVGALNSQVDATVQSFGSSATNVNLSDLGIDSSSLWRAPSVDPSISAGASATSTAENGQIPPMPGSQEFIDQHDSAALASANRNLVNVEAAWAQEKQESAGSLNLWNACYANACIALENQKQMQAVESAFPQDLLNLGQATGLRPIAQSFYASSLGYDQLADKYWDQGTFNLGSFIVISAATEGLGEILAPEALGLTRTIDAGALTSTEAAGVDLAASGAYGSVRFTPSADVLNFAGRYEAQLNDAVANRMLTLGIPEESIGLQGTPFSNAFETRFAQGGGNLNPAWSGVQNPVINVDVAALDSQFNPTSPTWATSSWKDRIDAITAHEWTEVFSPRTDTVILQGQPVLGRHIDALMNAPYTQLPITPGAKQILLEDRAYWIGGQQ